MLGGLGGLGLELADWLIVNGAKRVVLSSRKGVATGYQSWRIKNWQSYGAKVIVVAEDAMTLESATKLMNIALRLGPISAIFNLAVVNLIAIMIAVCGFSGGY